MTRKKKDDRVSINYYVVAFFDLLGQQEHLRNLRSLPNPSDLDDMRKVLQSLKDTYGAVTQLRRWFSESFKVYAKKHINIDTLTKEQLKTYEQFTSNPIKFQRFSDSIAVYLSLREDTAKLSQRGVFGILSAAASTFICCLATGHPIRGGIDVGLGIELSGNEIYGPALSRAYALESRIADYPRIVVGDEFVTYLQTTRDQPPKDLFATAAKKTAALCLDCLAVDDDGHIFLDYLGATYLRLFGDAIDARPIQMAYNQILKFSDEYKKDKNSNLAFRYTLLRNYFEARLPIWAELLSKPTQENERCGTQQQNASCSSIQGSDFNRCLPPF